LIKVLVVDDSPVIRQYLSEVLSTDAEVRVIATAADGEEALAALQREKPDVITMDIDMPRMNGLEATRRIMESCPLPVVIVSASVRAEEVATSFAALEAGAVAVLEKPPGPGHPDYAASLRQLLATVKGMSEVKVVRRWARLRDEAAVPNSAGKAIAAGPPARDEFRLVAVGASTGGPQALQAFLSALPCGLAAPVLMVQHIAPGFLHGLADWLNRASPLPVHIAVAGEPLLAGTAYLAPDGFHTGVTPDGRVDLQPCEPENGLRPAVSYLFRSAAAAFGRRCIGVLLTGMGRDGAIELKQLRDRGAMTFAQDQATSVVFGMPAEAIRLSAAAHVLPPQHIAAAVAEAVGVVKTRGPA
jgi:two-component system, chemotaxis family, protein-glutamate methylesterase/glutaminase